MVLSKESTLCLLIGIVALAFVMHSLITRKLFPTIVYVPVPAQPIGPVGPVKVSEQIPSLTPAEERQRLEAQIESQNRDRWCREFEEMEIKRVFRERYGDEEVMKILECRRRREEAHNMFMKSLPRA
jgi:hypothetical protein